MRPVTCEGVIIFTSIIIIWCSYYLSAAAAAAAAPPTLLQSCTSGRPTCSQPLYVTSHTSHVTRHTPAPSCCCRTHTAPLRALRYTSHNPLRYTSHTTRCAAGRFASHQRTRITMTTASACLTVVVTIFTCASEEGGVLAARCNAGEGGG